MIELNTLGHLIRRARVGFICLGVIGTFAAEGRCIAQNPYIPGSTRLTIRPHEMATGRTNQDSGVYSLFPNVSVFIPKQCAGEHRCPLLVFLLGTDDKTSEAAVGLRSVADKYGMILLFSTEYKTDIMDVALIHTVRRFAIDPDKIAIAGRRSARAIAMRYGIDNLNVFSRIAAVSASVGGGGIPTKGIHPYNKTTEFLVEAGIEEAYGTFKDVQELRRDGHPVKQIISLINIRYVGGQPAAEDYDFLGRWLQQSWTRSEARPAPSVLADPLPLLTTEVLDKMSDFWNMFGSESVSNDLAAHNAHRREVVVPVGQERPSVWMPDMPALAAQYPSIAANLERVGLTAQQEEAYRVAIISARATRLFGNEIGTVDPTSVLAKNVEVMSGRQQGNYFPLLDR